MLAPVWAFVIALAASVSAQAGPDEYIIRYYPFTEPACTGQAIRCITGPLECCAAPPARNTFYYARVNSGGNAGILVWHETDETGDCLGCTGTAAINTCYLNRNPFETITVFDPADPNRACPFLANEMAPAEENDASISSDIAVEQRSAASYKAPVCKKPDTASMNGQIYKLPASYDEDFINDFANMTADAFLQKHKLEWIGEDHDDDEVGSADGGQVAHAKHVKEALHNK